MKELIISVMPVILVSLWILSVSAFVVIRSDISYLAKFLVIPTFIACAVLAPISVGSLLGYSVLAELPERFLILSHRTIVIQAKKEFIELWIKQRVGKTRLIKVPWSKELEEILEKAAEGREKGLNAEIKKKKGVDEEGSSGLTLEFLEPPGKDSDPKKEREERKSKTKKSWV